MENEEKRAYRKSRTMPLHAVAEVIIERVPLQNLLMNEVNMVEKSILEKRKPYNLEDVAKEVELNSNLTKKVKDNEGKENIAPFESQAGAEKESNQRDVEFKIKNLRYQKFKVWEDKENVKEVEEERMIEEDLQNQREKDIMSKETKQDELIEKEGHFEIVKEDKMEEEEEVLEEVKAETKETETQDQEVKSIREIKENNESQDGKGEDEEKICEIDYFEKERMLLRRSAERETDEEEMLEESDYEHQEVKIERKRSKRLQKLKTLNIEHEEENEQVDKIEINERKDESEQERLFGSDNQEEDKIEEEEALFEESNIIEEEMIIKKSKKHLKRLARIKKEIVDDTFYEIIEEDEAIKELEFGDNQEKKWNYLEYKGFDFPPLYEYKGFLVEYDGKKVKMTPEQEEMAYCWSESVGTEWEENKVYRKNFFKEFKKTFKKKLGYTDFDSFDFSDIVGYIEDEKAMEKEKTAREKKAEKEKKKEKDDFYGFAIVDNCKEKILYSIEPPTLFKTKGNHPKIGVFKPSLLPEDLTINIAISAPVPKCDFVGHAWGGIVHNNKVSWLASYCDDKIDETVKFISIAEEDKPSKSKKETKETSQKKETINNTSNKDTTIYDTARRLKDHIETIRQDYNAILYAPDELLKQFGTAMYFIDVLGFRIGGENPEEAEGVGCCDLLVEHIQTLGDYEISFNASIEGSLKYMNKVKVDRQVWLNIDALSENKLPKEKLFDKIEAESLTNYLSSQMEGLTAKVLRTYNVNYILDKELNKRDLERVKPEEKLFYFKEVDRRISNSCNYQKAISASFDEAEKKLEFKIEDMKKYQTELQNHLKKRQTGKSGLEEDKYNDAAEKKFKSSKYDDELLPRRRKFFRDVDDVNMEIESLKDEMKVEREELKKIKKEKENALEAFKFSYNDPRIIVRWCNKNEVPIEKLFTKAERSKISWALQTEADWTF